MLHIEDLHVSIGDKEVLNGINLRIGEARPSSSSVPTAGARLLCS